jgi:hypothetical protein
MWATAALSSGWAVSSLGSSSISRQRVMAPRRTPSSAISMCRRSDSLRRSTSSEGWATRKAIIGTRLWPPASALASPPPAASSATASASVAGQAYSNAGSFIQEPTLHAATEPKRMRLLPSRRICGQSERRPVGRVFARQHPPASVPIRSGEGSRSPAAGRTGVAAVRGASPAPVTAATQYVIAADCGLRGPTDRLHSRAAHALKGDLTRR